MAYFGLLLYCVLVYIRPSEWVAAVLGWPLEFMALGLTIVIALVGFLTSPNKHQMLAPFGWLLAAWVTVILLSNLVHGNVDDAIDNAIVYGKRALVFIAFILVIDSIRRLRWLLIVLMILAAVLGAQGIYQKAHGVGWAGQKLYWDDRICWIGLWDGANVLSLLFVSTVPIILEVLLGKWGVLAKVVAVVSAVFVIDGMILAASRGGWVSLAVILALFFTRRFGKSGMIVAAVAIAGLVFVAPSRLSREGDERDESSTKGRIEMWSQGLEMLKYNPVFGIGKGRFLSYSGMLIAHNSYVQNMGETGLVGLFVWIGLIYASFKSLRVVIRNKDALDPRIIGLAQASAASLTGYLAASMFISTDFDLFYMLMGMCVAVLIVARRESGRDLAMAMGLWDFCNVGALVVTIVVVMYVATRSMS